MDTSTIALQPENQTENNGRAAPTTADQRLATGLGWFSIGLGIAEVVAPERVARLIGLGEDHSSLLRTYGLREIASGIGILSQPQPAHWVWSRVAGDLLDLASLGSAITSNRNDRAKLLTATAAVAGVTALDVICAQSLTQPTESNRAAGRQDLKPVLKTIIINKSPEEVYQFWRNFQNFPSFMKHLESVEDTGQGRSHWRAKAPVGTVEWDAEITEDQPNSFISWRSVEGSQIHNSGSVRFLPATGNRGTLLRVELQYRPPAGAAGAAIAKLFGEEPSQQIDDDLRALKQILETGEVVKSDASIHRGMHPAQPTEEAL